MKGAALTASRTPSDAELFSVNVTESDGEHTVRFVGELDIADAERAERCIIEVAGSTVTLELSSLTFMDASGLGAILRAKECIEAEGHALEVRGADGIVRRVFEVTGFAQVPAD